MLTYPREINYACKIENTLSQILAVFTYLYSKNPGTSQTHDTLLNDFYLLTDSDLILLDFKYEFLKFTVRCVQEIYIRFVFLFGRKKYEYLL